MTILWSLHCMMSWTKPSMRHHLLENRQGIPQGALKTKNLDKPAVFSTTISTCTSTSPCLDQFQVWQAPFLDRPVVITSEYKILLLVDVYWHDIVLYWDKRVLMLKCHTLLNVFAPSLCNIWKLPFTLWELSSSDEAISLGVIVVFANVCRMMLFVLEQNHINWFVWLVLNFWRSSKCF